MKQKLGLAAFMGCLLLFALNFVSLAEDAEVLSVAFIGHSEGRNASEDLLIYQAAVLAAEEINTNDDGGIIAPDESLYQLEIVYYEADSESEVLEAVDEALENDVIAILGPNDPLLAAALADEGTPAVPIFLGAANATTGASIYRLVADYATWGEAVADYWVNERHSEALALVSVNTSTAIAGTEAVIAAAGEEAIALSLSLEADEEDLNAEARSIRDADVDVLFAWLLDAQMDLLLAELETLGWQGEVVFANLDEAYLASHENLEGLWGISNWTANAYDSASQAFASAYLERWDSPALATVVPYYDAVLLLANALATAGNSNASIVSALNNNSVQGVQGLYSNSSIDAVKILEVRAGQFVEAASYADGICQNCSDMWLEDNSTSETTSEVVYTIGLIIPLDAAMNTLGEQIEDAVRLAIREINDAGGVLTSSNSRYSFALRVYSANNIGEASSALEEAIADGVDIVLGPDSNGQVLNNLYIAADAGTVQLVSANSSLIIAGASDSLFQLSPSDETMTTVAANYLLDVRELTTYATVAIRTDYGLDNAESFGTLIESSEDGQLSLALEHDVDARDMDSLAQELLEANVEAIAVWSSQPAFADLLAALDALGWQGVLHYAYLTNDFVASLPLSESIEVIGTVSWWNSSQDWLSVDFSARYQARYAQAPLPETASYYDAVYMLAAALGEGSDVQTWLSNTESFVGVQGTYQMATYANGETSRSSMIIRLGTNGVEVISRYNGENCRIYCN